MPGFLTTLFAALWTRIFAGLAALFLLGFVTQTIRIEGAWMVVGFKEEVAVLRMDLSKIKQAQQWAEEAAKAAKAREELAYSNIAERADNEVQNSSMRASAARYAERNRLRSKAPSRPSSGASAASPASNPESPVGASEDASVVVSRTDFDQLVENTIRLKAAHDWAEGLVDMGLATEDGR